VFSAHFLTWAWLLIGLVQEIPEVIKFVGPVIGRVPLLGKIIPFLQAGELNEAKALEQLQSEMDKNKKQRTKARQEQNKHVIKISDAMQCVEENLNGKFLLSIGRAVLNALTGKPDNAGDILYDAIFQCMLSKALQQNNARSVGKYVKTKNTPEPFSEIISLRRGKLHPFIPPDSG
jgi:hypothetical protein